MVNYQCQSRVETSSNRITLPRALFYFWLDPKVTKNQVGTNAFLGECWVVRSFDHITPKTRIGQTVLQPEIFCFFIEFSGLALYSKGPILYAAASDVLKRCLRLVIFSFFKQNQYFSIYFNT